MAKKHEAQRFREVEGARIPLRRQRDSDFGLANCHPKGTFVIAIA
jgi:hypothetical protein